MAARSAALLISVAFLASGLPGGKIAEQQFALADDGRQDAVELVRDAARQFADGFHFLGLEQLRFEPFARGDVALEGHKVRRSFRCHREWARFAIPG